MNKDQSRQVPKEQAYWTLVQDINDKGESDNTLYKTVSSKKEEPVKEGFFKDDEGRTRFIPDTDEEKAEYSQRLGYAKDKTRDITDPEKRELVQKHLMKYMSSDITTTEMLFQKGAIHIEHGGAQGDYYRKLGLVDAEGKIIVDGYGGSGRLALNVDTANFRIVEGLHHEMGHVLAGKLGVGFF